MSLFDKFFKKPEPVQTQPEPPKNTVKVTDIDGSVFGVSVNQVISSKDRVLITDKGEVYHTHLSCFKKWSVDSQKNFTGWTIIKKSEAKERGMRYCKICAIADNVTLDDVLAELDEEYK